MVEYLAALGEVFDSRRLADNHPALLIDTPGAVASVHHLPHSGRPGLHDRPVLQGGPVGAPHPIGELIIADCCQAADPEDASGVVAYLAIGDHKVGAGRRGGSRQPGNDVNRPLYGIREPADPPRGDLLDVNAVQLAPVSGSIAHPRDRTGRLDGAHGLAVEADDRDGMGGAVDQGCHGLVLSGEYSVG